MTSTLLEGKQTRAELWSGPVIDADVHANVPSLEALLAHMEPQWAEFCRERRFSTPQALANVYPPNAPSTARPEWRPADGKEPASELSMLQRDVLDRWDVDFAILNCYWAVDWVRHPDFAPALARAINNWLLAEWLERDPRLRASLILPARHPAEMIKEIERLGDHPGFVQAFFPVRSDLLYGNRQWHPVYESLQRHGLVLGLHWGGVSETAAPSPTGWASWFVEEYAQEQQLYMAQVMSLIAEGVFAAFPDLRVSVQEIGFAWLPPIWWRMEAKRKGLRRDIPWVNQAIPEVFRDHFKFTVAPLDAGPPEHFANTLAWLGSDDMLMFATDYPHAHHDDIEAFLGLLSEPARAKLMAGNARELYQLPVRAT
jgi:predicted TIM-barrel fold metal-dependent hydrolase